jgi:ferredoxin
MKAIRNIIRINEDLCNGCGQCASACAEGAIAMIDGKAKLISEVYCDGLGACIGECPTGALTIEQREADEFDETLVEQHLARQGRPPLHAPQPAACPSGGCPSAMARTLRGAAAGVIDDAETPSRLANWPVQLMLVPPTAPYLKNASLVIAADCTSFAYADFHKRFLGDRVLLIGCPKLDDAAYYKEKLTQLIGLNGIQDIEVVYMEVPCCSGLVRVVQNAVAECGQGIPLTLTKIGIQGEIKDRQTV